MLAQFALESQRSGVAFASPRHHAPVVASAVQRQEIAMGVVKGHSLGDRRSFDDVCRAKLFQKILCGRAERLAKFDQAIEPRNEVSWHRGPVLKLVGVQAASRIDEES